jgi:hypothetical protein
MSDEGGRRKGEGGRRRTGLQAAVRRIGRGVIPTYSLIPLLEVTVTGRFNFLLT